jgi:AmiR/NasT family two-component response regulator
VALSEQLQTALHSRIVIEQAKGILSAQGGTDVAEAFRLMRTHARRSGQSLTAVAEAVIAGSLDATRIGQGVGP